MDQQQQRLERKNALVAELQSNRVLVGVHASSLKAKVNIPGRIKSSFANNTTKWLIGSAATAASIGLLGKGFIGGRKKGSIVGFLARKSAIALIKPYLVSWAIGKASEIAQRRQQQPK